MHLPNRAATSLLYVAALSGLCSAQEWTETSVVQKFLEQSPYARESRARVAITEAEAKGRSLYANPSVSYSREGAGLTEFFQAQQTIPINGRLKLLRQAGVPDGRVSAVGMGARQPVAKGATARAKAQNRRVELYIIPSST